MQIIIILEIFKDFFPCKIVWDPNQQYPEYLQRLFRLQYCLRCKSSLSWKYSKNFSPAKLSWAQIIFMLKIFTDFFACNIVLDANHHYPENIQRRSRLQKLSYTKIIIVLKVFKDFFACNFVLTANHHYPENIQRIFYCKIVLAANHLYPENIQRLFCLQTCLSRKSSLSWKCSKTSSPAKLS